MGLSIYQIMNKHKSRIKESMDNNRDLSKDFFNVNKTFVT
jgi:hypothetical protein